VKKVPTSCSHTGFDDVDDNEESDDTLLSSDRISIASASSFDPPPPDDEDNDGDGAVASDTSGDERAAAICSVICTYNNSFVVSPSLPQLTGLTRQSPSRTGFVYGILFLQFLFVKR
jgi:hypothetical protein